MTSDWRPAAPEVIADGEPIGWVDEQGRFHPYAHHVACGHRFACECGAAVSVGLQITCIDREAGEVTATKFEALAPKPKARGSE